MLQLCLQLLILCGNFLYKSFQEFAGLKGIHLLKKDIDFIKSCISKIPSQDVRSALIQYANIWLKTMHNTDIVYQKQNRGRYAANVYLRELTENGNRNV